ncbi:hypothetical protein TNCV_762771 [Trichonephila clavipes]|nr:hypothetical protein TNCV_762771 [Trichonephila clavipes]
MYCVNCEAYGHMANHSKCPYHKPSKSAVVKPNYSHVINSLVRSKTSFAQVAQQTQATVKPSAPLMMMPHVKKYDPDILLIQETRLRPTLNININNYTCYRNDRLTNGPDRGGTLIFIKSSIPHFNSPTLHHVEATTVTLTPPNTNHISITSIYVPPRSDNLLFTLDLETILQINSNCVIFGDFNATHNSWNCSNNFTRGFQLKNFANTTNLERAFPNTPTRYGYNSFNTLDFALISNFNFPYNIKSISELSSDHNPVTLSFTLTSTIHKHNSRAITTFWSAFSSNLKIQIHLYPTSLK